MMSFLVLISIAGILATAYLNFKTAQKKAIAAYPTKTREMILKFKDDITRLEKYTEENGLSALELRATLMLLRDKGFIKIRPSMIEILQELPEKIG